MKSAVGSNAAMCESAVLEPCRATAQGELWRVSCVFCIFYVGAKAIHVNIKIFLILTSPRTGDRTIVVGWTAASMWQPMERDIPHGSIEARCEQ